MSKKRIVEIVNQSGVKYGQITDPLDIVKAQDYSHAHAETITKDFLNGAVPEVVGCGFGIGSGLSLNISEGRIYKAGKQFDCAGATVAATPAHNTHPRIDLVIATIAENVPALTEFVGFQRIRTEQEFIDNEPPLPPTQFQRSRERWNTAALSVKVGTAGASPVAPSLGANEVLLYTLKIPASAGSLVLANVTDSRKAVSNLDDIKVDLTAIQAQLAKVEDKLKVLAYRYPTTLTADGKLPMNIVDTVEGWVCDIPVGIDVQFGDGFVKIKAENFEEFYEGESINAQYVNISNGVVTYLPLVEPEGAPTHNATTGNVIRFLIPQGVNALYLNRDGELFFRDTTSPSGATECLLLKFDNTDPGGAIPDSWQYRNLRNAITRYSGTKQPGQNPTFRLDLGFPSGILYPQCYAISAADQHLYNLPIPTINFDSWVTVTGVTDGDFWAMDFWVLSAF